MSRAAHYNWCIVPDSGADGVLYAAVAVLLGCLVSGKLSSVWILCSGALLELAAYTYNLRRFSNASAIWLGMHPPDLFFYTFLPPLLLDAAVRIEFFTFRKVRSPGPNDPCLLQSRPIRTSTLQRAASHAFQSLFDLGNPRKQLLPLQTCQVRALRAAQTRCTGVTNPKALSDPGTPSVQVAGQVMTFAVGAVIGMVAIMTPLFLYGFDLAAAGWHWSHAALFVCMIASTDVVAVTAVLKKCNGPETLAVLMEGPSMRRLLIATPIQY